jgi:nucleoside-diphosphate-sugar epimerase
MNKGNTMSAATILITGASGFIGGHLLPYLLERDYV